MIAAILAWLAVLVSPFFLILALKIFPKLLGDIVIKELEHRHNVRLEQIKAELARSGAGQIETLKADMAAAYSTLKSSVDFLASSQEEVRIRRVNSIGKIWLVLISLNKEFANLLFIDTILLSWEIDKLFKANVGPELETLLSGLKEYREEDTIIKKWERAKAEDIETERLFVSTKMWQIYFVTRALYGRVAILFQRSFNGNRYNDWRNDEVIEKLLVSVLPTNSVAQAKTMTTQGLQALVLELHNEFLEEAEKIMSGAQSLSKSIADVQTALLGEKEKLTADMRGKFP